MRSVQASATNIADLKISSQHGSIESSKMLAKAAAKKKRSKPKVTFEQLTAVCA